MALVAALSSGGKAAAAPRVLSLDQCADQYVLALAPRTTIVGLSTRADDADSYLRDEAAGLPRRRATLESALAARPTVVVRYWGGDPRLLRALQARGARVLRIDEATDFAGVARNVRQVAAGLGRPAAGERLVARMMAQLQDAAGAWGGAPALYVTPGGVTAGPSTLVGAILTAAGLRNLEQRDGYRMLSLERLALDPPRAVVLGFFEAATLATSSWGAGRHQLVRRAARRATRASLPGALLGCPAWFAADAVSDLAARAPR